MESCLLCGPGLGTHRMTPKEKQSLLRESLPYLRINHQQDAHSIRRGESRSQKRT